MIGSSRSQACKEGSDIRKYSKEKMQENNGKKEFKKKRKEQKEEKIEV